MKDRTPYTPRLYLDTLLALGGREVTNEALEAFIFTSHEDAAGPLKRLVELTGAETRF